MSQSAFERIQTLLVQLSKQAIAIDKSNATLKAHKLLTDNALFSETLFVTHSDKFYAYVKEIERKVNELDRLIAAGQTVIAFNQLPLIEQQITSLVNAFNANNSMHNEAQNRLNAFKTRRFKKAAKAVMSSSHELHQKLAETREFERRLAEMIADRERQRTNNSQAVTQQKLATEILTLHQRLGRCRQAISKIERDIELSEKRGTQHFRR